MVDNRANAQTYDGEGRCVPRGVLIRLRKGIDIFRVRNGHFKLAPRHLREI